MPTRNPQEPLNKGGLDFGDAGESVDFRSLGDIVAGNKINYITQVIDLSDEVKARPLVQVSPYRGLESFQRDDRELFFGRDRLIKKLIKQLSPSPMLVVLGASGSGKSSLVRAGLLPRLSKLLRQFSCFTLVPDIDPFLSLLSSLISSGRLSQAKTEPLLQRDPGIFPAFLQSLKRPGDQWLFFVDQFEEVFTQTDEGLRKKFIDALLAIAGEPSGSTKVVLGLRFDFMERLSAFPDFADLVDKSVNIVTDMEDDELRLAIEQPAARHGVRFEKELVDAMIKDVQGQAGALPLLQYTLDLLWEEERKHAGLADRTLKTQTYRELGGAQGALQKRADEIYTAISKGSDPKTSSERQEVVRKIFLRLVNVPGIQDTMVRRRVPIASFQGAGEKEVLAELITERLLVINRDVADLAHTGNGPAALVTAGEVAHHPEDNVATSKPIVEVAHEAIFTCWPKLKQWITDAQAVIFMKNRLAHDCRRWKQLVDSGAAGAYNELWRGLLLREALKLRASNYFEIVVESLNEDENRFLDLSAKLPDELQQRESMAYQRALEGAYERYRRASERATERATEVVTARSDAELAKKREEELRAWMKREIEHAIKTDELAQRLRQEWMWRPSIFFVA